MGSYYVMLRSSVEMLKVPWTVRVTGVRSEEGRASPDGSQGLSESRNGLDGTRNVFRGLMYR